MGTLQPNDKAPDFKLLDQNGRKRSLSEFKGRKLLIYFYPKANTPGCTTQCLSVSAARENLRRQGVEVAGVSPDSPEALKKFDEGRGLGFTLLSDPDHETAEAFGVWGEKKMYGKTRMGIIRSSFLLDEKGKVAAAWYKVSPEDTVPKALEALSGASAGS